MRDVAKWPFQKIIPAHLQVQQCSRAIICVKSVKCKSVFSEAPFVRRVPELGATEQMKFIELIELVKCIDMGSRSPLANQSGTF